MHFHIISYLMSTLKFSLIFFILLSLFHSTKSTTPICANRYCGNPDLVLTFPFQVREENQINNNQSDRCAYLGFEVYCNNKNQTLLTLSNRKFVVKYISHERQRISINGPKGCPPKRFLQNIIFNDFSPFLWDYNAYENVYYENVTFLNCTNFAKDPNIDNLPIIPCLSNDKYSIMYTLPSTLNSSWNQSCHEIGFARVPVEDNSGQQMVIMEGLYSDIFLRWTTPSCYCGADQYCGFLSITGLYVSCYKTSYMYGRPDGNPPTATTKPKSNYFFPLVWGISGILFFLWIALSVCKGRMAQNHNQQQRQTVTNNIEPSNREPPWFVLGLDHSRIEKYPKIQLAESGQLPKSIDNVCSICLSEYKPMETLRSIPQCNHHFHADCIDVWLKMNATCPLCRNLPE